MSQVMNPFSLRSAGSGEIEFHEFLEMMVAQMREQDEGAEIERMFQVFDKDQNNFVSTGELK